MKRNLLFHFYTLSSYSKRFRWKGSQKIFCISLQKSGTTSVGDFFQHFGYPVVRSDLAQFRGWNKAWFRENYTKIFEDPVFKNYQVFEDAPFWAKDFYKILHKKFPKATYILFTRNSDDWFDSLVHHGEGEILGDKRFHAKNYNRAEVLHNANFNIKNHRAYYTQFYERRNREIIEYFEGEKAPFFYSSLEEPLKWSKLANFLNFEIPDDFEIHSNSRNQ